MSRWRSLGAVCLLVAVGLGGPGRAAAQTFPSDDAGRPAPWDAYIDDSVTPNVSVPVSTSHPLPTSGGAATIATDTLGYGRSYFFSASGAITALMQVVLFTDQINVVGWGQGASMTVAQSADGGRTWGPATLTGFAIPNGLTRVAGLTVSPTPRFVIAPGNVRLATSPNPTGGWVASTFTGGGLNATPLAATFAIQGATVMLWSTGGGAGLTAVACKSTDNGQTFPTPCVTVDAGLNQGFVGPPAQTITSPAAGIWIAVTATGKLYRSADDGATWSLRLTVPGGAAAAVKCLSASVCLTMGAGGIVERSIDGGVTWTSPATIGALSASPPAGTFCDYGNNVVNVIAQNNFPGTLTTATVPVFRSANGGLTWVGATVTGGQTSFPLGNMASTGQCSTTAGGRAVFTNVRGAEQGVYYGPTTSNTVQILGANGIPINIDGNGNLTANQGLATASAAPWPTTPVQGPTLFNTSTTGVAAAAVTATITALAGARGHVYTVAAYCSAGTATLTVADGVTTIWTAPAGFVTTTLTSLSWTPAGLTGTTGNAMTVTLSTCGGGNTGTLNVEADRS